MEASGATPTVAPNWRRSLPTMELTSPLAVTRMHGQTTTLAPAFQWIRPHEPRSVQHRRWFDEQNGAPTAMRVAGAAERLRSRPMQVQVRVQVIEGSVPRLAEPIGKLWYRWRPVLVRRRSIDKAFGTLVRGSTA